MVVGACISPRYRTGRCRTPRGKLRRPVVFCDRPFLRWTLAGARPEARLSSGSRTKWNLSVFAGYLLLSRFNHILDLQRVED